MSELKNMIYLASPYSHPDEAVMEARYDEAMSATAFLMNQGIVIFSPIVHCHQLKLRFNLPGDHNFWLTYDESILRHCFAMWILCIDGWNESKGIASEIEFCKRNNIRISYIHNLTRPYGDGVEHSYAARPEPPEVINYLPQSEAMRIEAAED